MNINIQVQDSDSPVSILAVAHALTAFADYQSGQVSVATSAPTIATVEEPSAAQATPAPEEKPRQRRGGNKPQPEPAPEQPQSAPDVQDSKPDPAPAHEPEPQNDAPTVVELRAKAQEVATTPEAKKKIKALIDEFGAKLISDIAEDKRVDFLAKLSKVNEADEEGFLS